MNDSITTDDEPSEAPQVRGRFLVQKSSDTIVTTETTGETRGRFTIQPSSTESPVSGSPPTKPQQEEPKNLGKFSIHPNSSVGQSENEPEAPVQSSPMATTAPVTGPPAAQQQPVVQTKKGRFTIQPSVEPASTEAVVQPSVNNASEAPTEETRRGRFTIHPPDKPPTAPPQEPKVKETKGRFKILETTPVESTAASSAPADNASAPVVQKRGRFMVTNVPIQALIPATPTAAMAPVATMASITAVAPADAPTASAYQPAAVVMGPPVVYSTLQTVDVPPAPDATPPPATTTEDIPEITTAPSEDVEEPKPKPRARDTQGLGKVFYFLDQMKSEVSQADKSIKSLRLENKCLKDKNKELEAMAREWERRYQAEKNQRELAETRVKGLKKKLRALRETEVEPLSKEEESIGTHQTGGLRSRANSLDAMPEEPSGYQSDSGAEGANIASISEAIKETSRSTKPGTSVPVSADVSQGDTANKDRARTPPIVRSTTTVDDSNARDTSRPRSLQTVGTNGSDVTVMSNGTRDSLANPIPVSSQTTMSLSHTLGASHSSLPATHMGRGLVRNVSGGLRASSASMGCLPSAAETVSMNGSGAPPRPAPRKRPESTRPNAFDFDPLRPQHQQQGSIGSTISETSAPAALHMFTQAPLLMMNSDQTMAMPIVGMATAPTSDVQNYMQVPMVAVHQQQGAFVVPSEFHATQQHSMNVPPMNGWNLAMNVQQPQQHDINQMSSSNGFFPPNAHPDPFDELVQNRTSNGH